MVVLVFGACQVVLGVGLWSAAAAFIVAGLLIMVGAVALAYVQEAAQSRFLSQVSATNGVAPQAEEAVR